MGIEIRLGATAGRETDSLVSEWRPAVANDSPVTQRRWARWVAIGLAVAVALALIVYFALYGGGGGSGGGLY
jgi:hypothetical protein